MSSISRRVKICFKLRENEKTQPSDGNRLIVATYLPSYFLDRLYRKRNAIELRDFAVRSWRHFGR